MRRTDFNRKQRILQAQFGDLTGFGKLDFSDGALGRGARMS